MIQRIPANQRHFSDFGWLKTYWLFSFDTYFDPQNQQLGTLRVFNDDVIEAGQGFPTHPHRDMEIVTIMLEGELTHADSMGNGSVIHTGEIQRMTAGKGITHSEINRGTVPCHLYQIWIFPTERRLEPGYEQCTIAAKDRLNRLQPVASGEGVTEAVRFHTDATIYLSDLEAGKELIYRPRVSRHQFVYLSTGELKINDTVVSTNDQARISSENELTLRATATTHLILIDIPEQR